MLIGTWIVTFVLIIGVGIYAGTKITQANQWSGGDRSMSVFAVGAMLGGMADRRYERGGSCAEWIYHGNCRVLVFYCQRAVYFA